MQHKTKLAVFDFDGTIAMVPLKPKDWKGKDWWGNEESLSKPLYNGEVNEKVVELFHKAQKDPTTHTILLTGRRGVIAHSVRNILRTQGLHGSRMIDSEYEKAQQKFNDLINCGKDIEHKEELEGHDQYFSGDQKTHPDFPKMKTKKGKTVADGSTFAHKSFVIEKVFKENGGYQVIELWDDREDHIQNFYSLGKKLFKNSTILQKYIIHQVLSSGYIKDIEVQP